MGITTKFPDFAESLANLERWFDRQLRAEGSARIEKVTRLATGHSNETFLVELSWTTNGAPTTEEFVLRTPPEGVGLLEPYDLGKQFRVMAALRDTKVPAPEALWNEPDETLLGRPFFVMRKVTGEIFERSVPEWLGKAPAEQVHRICRRFIETLATVHQVDWRRAGLDDTEVRRTRARPVRRLKRVSRSSRRHADESRDARVYRGARGAGALTYSAIFFCAVNPPRRGVAHAHAENLLPAVTGRSGYSSRFLRAARHA